MATPGDPQLNIIPQNKAPNFIVDALAIGKRVKYFLPALFNY